jgi:hypothetical protein
MLLAFLFPLDYAQLGSLASFSCSTMYNWAHWHQAPHEAVSLLVLPQFCTLHQSFYHKSMFKLLDVVVAKVV